MLQVGAEFSALGLDKESGKGTGSAGIGLRVDFRLTRRVDVEGRVVWFPTRALQEFEAQGGRTTLAAAGVRGKFFTSSRASLYGVLLPGLLHFTNAVTSISGASSETGGATHFALDGGIGVELFSQSRWAARAEIAGPLYALHGTELSRSSPNAAGSVLVIALAPRFVNPWEINAGVSYRIGVVQQDRVEEPVRGRWEAGGQFSRTTSTNALSDSLFTNPAFGGFVSYRLAPSIYADAAVNAFLRKAPVRTPFDGGYLTQVLAGTKVGFRKDSWGLFVKTRIGVNSHSGAFTASDSFSITVKRSNVLAIDIGGVVERYVTRRLLIRFDAGDTISVFRPTTITAHGVRLAQPAPPVTDSLQMAVGLGCRF